MPGVVAVRACSLTEEASAAGCVVLYVHCASSSHMHGAGESLEVSCTLVACTVHVRALARIYAAAAQALAGPEPDLVKAYPPTLHACMQALVSLRARAIPLPKSSLHMHICVRACILLTFFLANLC